MTLCTARWEAAPGGRQGKGRAPAGIGGAGRQRSGLHRHVNTLIWAGQPELDFEPTPPCLDFSQPALFAAGLAAVERLRAENPAAVDGASATAGLSLGEYTALVFAGERRS